MSCGSYNLTVLSSTASSEVSGGTLSVTPLKPLSPSNEAPIKLLITNGTPSAGAILPVNVTLNGESVPVYDKYGNIVYGNQLYNGIILKGYFGNNGEGATAHFQLIRLPHRYYNY